MIISKIKSVIYEYVDGRGHGVVSNWLRERQDPDLTARVDQKIDLLEDNGTDLPPGLLSGTKHRSVDKLRIFGKKTTWRIMLSKERSETQFAFTLLFVAQEKDRKLIPKDAYNQAEGNRIKLIDTPERRQIYERDNE